jgi:hypothetical protein
MKKPLLKVMTKHISCAYVSAYILATAHDTGASIRGLVWPTQPVICQDYKNFGQEIKNIKHGMMLNEHPQHFTEFIIISGRNSRQTSDTTPNDTSITTSGAYPRNTDVI